MDIKGFDYYLPQGRIAQEPLAQRDRSKLLVVSRHSKNISQTVFKDIGGFFNNGDVLVLNNTKVLPVRLFAERKTGAKIELLLIEQISPGIWKSLIKPSKRVSLSEELIIPGTDYTAKVLERDQSGKWRLAFSPADAKSLMYEKGLMPTPPYIKKKLDKPQSYQTVFAEDEGSVACPTAGLHFTQDLISGLRRKGVRVVFVTLHVGLGTFRPIKTELVQDHTMDSEYCCIPYQTAQIINQAKAAGADIWACGTSSVRTLETYAYFSNEKQAVQVRPGFKKTDLFIYPGYKIKIVDKLITNFHLPRSTNLLMVASFLGKDLLLESYRYAVENNFRFYSFGDAMVIV